MPVFADDDTVTVEPFSRQPDGDEIIIGRVDLNVYLAVPTEAVWLLDCLAEGRTISEAREAYNVHYQESIDIHDFIEAMIQGRVIRNASAITQIVNDDPPSVSPPRRAEHFSSISQKLASRIFNKASVLVSLLLFGAALFCICSDTSLIPRAKDVYFPSFKTLSFALLITEGYVALFLHELCHLVAARAVGVRSTMGISHRLWFLVAETDLTELWTVPKAQRYLPLLAGPLFDMLSGSLLLLVLFYNRHVQSVLSPFWLHLLKAIVFANAMRLLWQFFLFVRTDFYYVITTFLGCRSLMTDTESFLKGIASRIVSRFKPFDPSRVTKRELTVIRSYSVIWIAGRLLSWWLLLYVTVNVMTRYIVNMVLVIGNRHANPGSFWDFVCFAMSSLVPFFVGITLWIRALVRGDKSRLAVG